MIKVTGSSVADSEVELIGTAARFFLDRLLSAVQQKKLTMKIDVTDRPGRTPIAIKWLVGSSGFFGWKPPRHFVMTVSVAAGVKDGLELAANEIVHVAQTLSGRLKISFKNRKVNDKHEDAYAASWVNGKFAFIDMTPRDKRLWEAEAHQLKTQLVNEFLAWPVNGVKKLPTQKPKKNGYGLYNIRPETTAALATNPTRPAPAFHEIDQLNDRVVLAAQTSDLSAAEAVVEPAEDQLAANKQPLVSAHGSDDATPPQNTSPSKKIKLPGSQHLLDQRNLVNHLDINSAEFKVAVNVPRLGKDRILDSTILHGKLNDLLERGLIPHAMAREAFRQAKHKIGFQGMMQVFRQILVLLQLTGHLVLQCGQEFLHQCGAVFRCGGTADRIALVQPGANLPTVFGRLIHVS